MTKIEELEQELFEMERKLKSMFNSCSKDLAIGIEKLRGELAELKESKKEGKWKPAIGEDFWHRDEGGLIACCHFSEYNQYNRWMIDNIPLFPTKEECERYWHFMDTVKEKSYEFTELEWKNSSIAKYEIYYHYHDYTWRIATEYHCRAFGTTYFKTREDAQYIIDNFKDELMEYWI